MDNMNIQYEHSSSQDHAYHDNQNRWNQTNGYVHHQTQGTDYLGFAMPSPHIPIEPAYNNGMNPPRPHHHQLQPLIMPQWPSMMISQSSYAPPIMPAMPATSMPISPPIPAPSQTSHTAPTPRRTLTDTDRRRMCLYHEEHPTTKQSEIGALFGVERSTVSKVLRQKEKYLSEDGSRSPIKRPKGKFPDIERALAVWAKNHQKQGLPLSDAIIKDKARFFATTVGSSDSTAKVTSASWLEKFKLKNNLMGAKTRKTSMTAEGEKGKSQAASESPSGRSPTPPGRVWSPTSGSMAGNPESVSMETPATYADLSHGRKPAHSLSITSLSSIYTDTTPSSFSPDPTSPTSPFFTPDSADRPQPSPFIPSPHSRIPIISTNFHRPRSQTFPLLNVMDAHGSTPPNEIVTPTYPQATCLDSPMLDLAPPLVGMSESYAGYPTSCAGTPTNMPPPPPPTRARMSVSPVAPSPGIRSSSAYQSPSQEEARRAMEVVMHFFQGQPPGSVEPQDYMTMGKLMEKLKLRGGLLPGGLHPLREPEGSMAA